MPILIQDLFLEYAAKNDRASFVKGVWDLIRYHDKFGMASEAMRWAIAGASLRHAKASDEAHVSLDVLGIHPSSDAAMFAFYPAGNLNGGVVTLYGWGQGNTLRACQGIHQHKDFAYTCGKTDEGVSPDALPFTALVKLALLAADEWMKEPEGVSE